MIHLVVDWFGSWLKTEIPMGKMNGNTFGSQAAEKVGRLQWKKNVLKCKISLRFPFKVHFMRKCLRLVY